MNAAEGSEWLMCQIGAREHYVLARELHRRGRLRALITDAWAPPTSLAARLPGSSGERLAERYDPPLRDAPVASFTGSLLRFELTQRVRRLTGWDLVIARNRWFESSAVRAMRDRNLLAERPVVFAYSYAARDIFREAKAAGCRTILGQIDPAVAEEEIVAEAVSRHPELQPRLQRAPWAYWQRWREECDLADCILVNSDWTREGLTSAGIAADKLRLVPLAYDAVHAQPRAWPQRFDAERPLRLLFLGSFNLRKGAAELLEAARLLRDAPVEIHVVGGTELAIPGDDRANPRLILHGSVPRQRVHDHFATADLFILPTLSDGFGISMLEAQAHGLPVVASRRCGNVVRNGVNGLLLDKVTGIDIATAINRYLCSPNSLAQHGAAALEAVGRFTASTITNQLLLAAGEPCGF